MNLFNIFKKKSNESNESNESNIICKDYTIFNQPVVKFNHETLFAFIDQIDTSGHHNTSVTAVTINDNIDVAYVNAITVCNLNKSMSEKVLIHVLHHESMHIAICFCLFKQEGLFIEKVIDRWILKKELYKINYTEKYKKNYTGKVKLVNIK